MGHIDSPRTFCYGSHLFFNAFRSVAMGWLTWGDARLLGTGCFHQADFFPSDWERRR